MPKKKQTQTEYMREHKVGFARLELNLQHIERDEKFSITKLGKIKVRGPVNARTAENLADAYMRGTEGKLTKTEDMLFDLLNGCKGPHEIKANTGLDDERCQEIYDWYKDVPTEMVNR
jgi:hypothetical protein